MFFVLLNIQNGILNDTCIPYNVNNTCFCNDDGIHIYKHICQELVIRYLFEKVQILETELNSLYFI